MAKDAAAFRLRDAAGYFVVFGTAAVLITGGILWGSIGTDWLKESKAKKVVAAQLRDPSSAQFRNLSNHSGFVCGEVNGKNGFGAYGGFVRFYGIGDTMTIDPQDKSVLFDGIPSPSDRFEREWSGYCQ